MLFRIVFVVFCVFSCSLFAQQNEPEDSSDTQIEQPESQNELQKEDEYSGIDFTRTIFSNKLRKKYGETRNPFWYPLGSFVIPGLDQFFERQYEAAMVYAGTAYIGIQLMANAARDYEEDTADDEIRDSSEFDEADDRAKRFIYGGSLYQTMGSLSAYHSFRTSVRSYHDAGTNRFGFLKPTIEEDTGDLLLAPFEFHYITRPTTFIPLAVLLGGVIWATSENDDAGMRLTGSDGLFLAGISYNAGVGEEALFRGWMFPYLYDATGSYFWSNAIQGTLFGAAHLSANNRLPWIQTLAGYYFGYMVERNNWSLREAVFLHAWWDVVAFSALFLNEDTRDQARIHIPLINHSF